MVCCLLGGWEAKNRDRSAQINHFSWLNDDQFSGGKFMLLIDEVLAQVKIEELLRDD